MMCTATKHGTVGAYRHQGCRCPDALAAVRGRRPRPSMPVDIDEVAVERACHGDRVPLTRRERRAAVALLDARGLSGNEIAERLGVTRRTVQRHRKALAAGEATTVVHSVVHSLGAVRPQVLCTTESTAVDSAANVPHAVPDQREVA